MAKIGLSGCLFFFAGELWRVRQQRLPDHRKHNSIERQR